MREVVNLRGATFVPVVQGTEVRNRHEIAVVAHAWNAEARTSAELFHWVLAHANAVRRRTGIVDRANVGMLKRRNGVALLVGTVRAPTWIRGDPPKAL